MSLSYEPPDYPVWTGYGRKGRHTPIDGEALGTWECLACGAPITTESDPEAPCPGRAQQDPQSPAPVAKERKEA